MRKVNFDGANLTDCAFFTTELADASFRESVLVRTNFNKSSLAGKKFTDVTLTDVSFTGATRRNVSCRLPFSVTNKSYRVFKTIGLDGAMMDKMTYTGLKGLWGANLSKAIVI